MAKKAAEEIPRIGGAPPERKKTAAELAAQFEAEALAELEQAAGAAPGPIARAVLNIAAMQLATCQELFRTGSREGDRQLLATAGTLANGARQNLVAAYNLAVKQSPPADDASGMEEFTTTTPAAPAKPIYHPKAPKQQRAGRPRSST